MYWVFTREVERVINYLSSPNKKVSFHGCDGSLVVGEEQIRAAELMVEEGFSPLKRKELSFFLALVGERDLEKAVQKFGVTPHSREALVYSYTSPPPFPPGPHHPDLSRIERAYGIERAVRTMERRMDRERAVLLAVLEKIAVRE